MKCPVLSKLYLWESMRHVACRVWRAPMPGFLCCLESLLYQEQSRSAYSSQYILPSAWVPRLVLLKGLIQRTFWDVLDYITGAGQPARVPSLAGGSGSQVAVGRLAKLRSAATATVQGHMLLSVDSATVPELASPSPSPLPTVSVSFFQTTSSSSRPLADVQKRWQNLEAMGVLSLLPSYAAGGLNSMPKIGLPFGWYFCLN